MKKNAMQDVVPAGTKRSIRDIELPSRAKAKEESSIKIRDVTVKEKEIKIEGNIRPPQIPTETKSRAFTYEYEEPKKPSKKWWYISFGLLVIAVAFGISALFKGATIRVTPKQQTETLSQAFTADKNATVNALGFQVVTISDSVQETVPATGQAETDTKAQGTIVIYNDYSTAAQKLVATTRFETPEGLIFRLVDPVTIPGKTTSGGQDVAGSIAVTVVADQTGADYNVGLKDFTIPGLEGTSKYSTMYARSETPMTGGFSGMQKTVAPDVAAQADTDLTASLKAAISKDITAQIPANFILYPDSISYTLNAVTQLDSTTGNAVLQKSGTATAIIFDKGILSNAIFAKVSPTLSTDSAEITNLDSLSFAYATGTSFDPATDTSVTFNLSGNTNIVWTFDADALKSALLGLSKKDAETLIATYPSIDEAWIETRPFWNQDIPKNPGKVSLINTLSQ